MKVYIAKFENEPNVIKYGKSVNPLERAVRLEKDYGRCIKLQIFEMNDTSSEKKYLASLNHINKSPIIGGVDIRNFTAMKFINNFLSFNLPSITLL